MFQGTLQTLVILAVPLCDVDLV